MKDQLGPHLLVVSERKLHPIMKGVRRRGGVPFLNCSSTTVSTGSSLRAWVMSAFSKEGCWATSDTGSHVLPHWLAQV